MTVNGHPPIPWVMQSELVHPDPVIRSPDLWFVTASWMYCSASEYDESRLKATTRALEAVVRFRLRLWMSCA